MRYHTHTHTHRECHVEMQESSGKRLFQAVYILCKKVPFE